MADPPKLSELEVPELKNCVKPAVLTFFALGRCSIVAHDAIKASKKVADELMTPVAALRQSLIQMLQSVEAECSCRQSASNLHEGRLIIDRASLAKVGRKALQRTQRP
ncbi:hypothetical protein [Bradyrhizobium sp. 172]|uniref:hypothetical protein n=1 Tax=Bradyrhizobium sp. 172 TaxID=2782643 RepID=UPI001FFE9239|nr:hypothetical protein [Bradyrhizobium sp. 172]UPJ94948.1 hypothetical protein IVB07_32010 [Bradyrhizobium sp. 172]